MLFDMEGPVTRDSEPVTCLGMTFENDEMRREYFLEKLRQKLEDPEFRRIEGFPIGEDEDILALSDPPYYTACPNPFIEDFIKHYGKPYDPATDDYHREPFSSDTGAGKTHPIYTAHSYHSKIPHLATMPCILHYTKPGDIVFDGFSGSGMTGVAAQLCGEPESIFKRKLEQDWKNAGYTLPKWGARRPILIDLSPVANFIGYNLNLDISIHDFKIVADSFFEKTESELGWMYETLHTDGKRKGRINYVVWSQVFTCPNCANDVVFIDHAYDPKTSKFAQQFPCSNCQSTLTKRICEHKFTTNFDKSICEVVRKTTYVPVEIEYTISGDKAKYRKKPDQHDLEILKKLEEKQPADWIPTEKLPIGKMRDSNHLEEQGITHYHQFYLVRALHALSVMWRIAGNWPEVRERCFLKFMVEQCFWGMTIMNRYGGNFYSQVNRFLG